MTTITREHGRMRAAALVLTLLVSLSRLPGQEATLAPSDSTEIISTDRLDDQLVAEISSHSGSPLLLQLSILDPQRRLTAVTVESSDSYTSYQIQPDPDRDSVQLTVSPFLAPGVYDLRIVMEAELEGESRATETLAQVGFVDFVFGRDNLRFGNNSEYTSVIGTYGEILDAWLDDRFGGITDVELVPLVDYMYQFFGKRSGRCYAFAGSEVLFWRWPELLPRFFDETYDFRAGVAQTQRDMNFLQLDMAFDHFLTGRYDLARAVAENSNRGLRDILVDEVRAIVSRIIDGQPVVVGFIGPELHHAMVVYGFIHRPQSGTIDLLVANNWKSEQDLNLRSSDAEAIRVFLDSERDGPIFEWRYIEGTRSREIDRLFIVEVERDYQHERDQLETLIATRLNRLSDSKRAVLVVEEAAGAWLTNGEDSTGYENGRTQTEIDDVLFDKVNRTYRFEYPADAELWLELEDDVGARILQFHPGDELGMETAWIEETPSPEEGAAIRRRLTLERRDPHWEVVAETGE